MTATAVLVDLEVKYPGIVVPAHLSMPRFVRTLGPEVAAVATLAGFSPDPEQQLLLDLTFAVDERGRSAASEIAVICCRQNLKTGFLKMVELGWLFVTDERLVVHSAHEFNTAREAYRDLKELIEASPVLLRRIKPGGFKDTPADMSIETVTGARLVFKTRTKGGGRGLSGRKIVLDEAFALQPAHMGALRPLISAQPDPQLIYASSAALADSEVLHGIVARGRKGDEPRLAYAEWCAQPPAEACQDGEACTHEPGKVEGCSYDDPEQWRRANPALGRRIAVETIADERRAAVGSLVREFGRERMGHHDDPISGLTPFDLEKWAEQADRTSELRFPVALAFDVQPGNLSASAATVGRLKVDARDLTEQAAVLDRWRGEVVDTRTGTDWLVGRLAEIATRNRTCALAYDPAAPAGAFRQALLDYRLDENDPKSTVFVEVAADEQVPKGKVRLVAITGREYAQACGALDADIRNDKFRHYGQKQLNDAIEGARALAVQDAWKASRKDSSVNIAPLVAVIIARQAFALYGGDAPKPTPWAMSI